MKKLTKKIPARRVIRYQCEVCKVKYRTEKQAINCEKRKLEPRQFSLLQTVWFVEPRQCGNSLYKAKCQVVKIIGPMLPDEDYENRHLGGNPARKNSHVFQYEVEFVCPFCSEKKRARYFTPELRAT